MVGCSSSLVAGWENGTREPGAGDIDTLSRLFDIAAEELLSPLTEQRVVLLRMTKEQYAEIQAHAKALGVTVKSYVLSNVAPGTTPGVAAPNALAQAPQRLQRLETALGAFFDSASDASDVGLHKAIAEGQAALRAKEE
jgi:transcriptional regulator with XRE-family HTH domain